LEKLSSWFSKVATDFSPRISDEPIRLYEAREYRAAVIAAVALLEAVLRERFTQVQDLPLRTHALRRLVEAARQQEIISQAEARRILDWLTVRNEVVHSHASVTRTKAKEIVDGIMNVIRKLQLDRTA
jgi:hypothetical protein